MAKTSKLPAFVVMQEPKVEADPSIEIMRTVFSSWPTGLVFGEEPGWLYPFRITGSVIAGSGVARWIVWTPLPAMLNTMSSFEKFPLASRIAWRSDPGPLSSALVTVNVTADRGAADPAAASRKIPSRSIFTRTSSQVRISGRSGRARIRAVCRGSLSPAHELPGRPRTHRAGRRVCDLVSKTMTSPASDVAPRKIDRILAAPRPHWVGDGFRVAGYFSAIPDAAAQAEPLPAARLPPAVTTTRPRKTHARSRRASASRLRDRDPRLPGQRRAPRQRRRRRSHRTRRRAVDDGRVGDPAQEYHEESYARRGGPLQMAQLWVNLPRAHKMDAPRYQAICSRTRWASRRCRTDRASCA